MGRKTYKHKATAPSAVQTIPQLRRLFESAESFVDEQITKRQSKDAISKSFRKEWKRLFMKDLDKSTADLFIDARMKSKKVLRHTRKQKHGKQGGGGVLQGAPLDYATRPGVYLESGQIPDKGQLPTMAGGGYGLYNTYVNAGFRIPEIAQSYDPVPGQSAWPIPYASTLVHKGGRRKIRGGNAFLTQAFNRPFVSDVPPGTLQDMQDIMHGSKVGASSDQVQRTIQDIQVNHTYPKL
jgi:hypothetical protein